MASSTDDQITNELHQRQNQAKIIRDSLTNHVMTEIMYNPNPHWPMLLQRLNVSLSQLEMLSNSINPLLQYYTISPTEPLPNPADTPLFLGTRPLAEMESEERALATDLKTQQSFKDSNEAQTIIDRYNKNVEAAEEELEKVSMDLLKRLKKEDRKSTSQRTA